MKKENHNISQLIQKDKNTPKQRQLNSRERSRSRDKKQAYKTLEDFVQHGSKKEPKIDEVSMNEAQLKEVKASSSKVAKICFNDIEDKIWTYEVKKIEDFFLKNDELHYIVHLRQTQTGKIVQLQCTKKQFRDIQDPENLKADFLYNITLYMSQKAQSQVSSNDQTSNGPLISSEYTP